MKRMMHKDHGFCHAYDFNEEERLRKLGWEEDDGEALRRKLNAAPQDDGVGSSPPGSSPDPVGAAPSAKKKPGRKPRAQ